MPQKWYSFTISDDDNWEEVLRTDRDNLFGIDDFDLQQGKQIEGWNPKAFLRYSDEEHDGVPEDLLCDHLGVPTVSLRLRKALEDAGVGIGDVQYLPIRVFKSSGEEVKGYSIMNVTTRVPALNYDRCFMLAQDDSKIDPLTGKLSIEGIGKAVLLESPLCGHDIVRLVEFWPPVYVSQRFAEVIRSNNFTGVDLQPIVVT